MKNPKAASFVRHPRNAWKRGTRAMLRKLTEALRLHARFERDL